MRVAVGWYVELKMVEEVCMMVVGAGLMVVDCGVDE